MNNVRDDSNSKIHYDSSATVSMLLILEKEPMGRAQLAAKLATEGINYTERTINRRLQHSESVGFVLNRKGHQIFL